DEEGAQPCNAMVADVAAPGRGGHSAGSLSDGRTMAPRQLGQQALAAVMEVLDRAAGPGPVLAVQAAEAALHRGERGGQVAAAVLVVQGQLAQGQPVPAL